MRQRVAVLSACAVIAAVLLHQSLAAQQEAAGSRMGSAPSGPRLERAVGYYDARLQRVVLVGGSGQPQTGLRDQVWSWNGRRWEIVTMSGPPSRTNAAGAYDLSSGKGVVAGGSTRSADGSKWEVLGDSWSGDRENWNRIGDIAPRDHQSMVTDGSGRVLLFGGIPAGRSGPWPTDTYQLGSDGWTRVASDGPAGRGRTAVAFDSARRQVVLFGGVTAPSGPQGQQTFLNDTWIWQDERWRKVGESGPPGRYAHAMVFDERARVVLLYSGSAAHSKAPLTDMWQWDGQRWSEVPQNGPTPGHRYQPVMVYDRARGKTVLYGGLGESKDDTWEWDGQRWQEIRPSD